MTRHNRRRVSTAAALLLSVGWAVGCDAPRAEPRLAATAVAVAPPPAAPLQPHQRAPERPGTATELAPAVHPDGSPWQLPKLGPKPWARTPCTPGAPAPTTGPQAVLACVGGVAVTRADFDRVRPLYAANVSNKAVVEALVRAEVLAAAALKQGLWSAWLVDPFKQALARRLIAREFEENYGPEQVKAKDIDRTWLRGAIRIRYAHEKAWWVTDAQLICCTGDWRKCEIDERAQACITRMQPEAYNLYGRLMMDPPQTQDHMCARVLAMKGDFPKVSCDHLNFFFDDSKTYEEQGDFDLMVKPYVLGVVQIPPGQIGKPIRSPYGWHIVRLNKVDPKKDGKLSDPDVRADIAEGILTGVRERDVQLRAIGLLRSNHVAIFYDNLDKGLIGQAPLRH